MDGFNLFSPSTSAPKTPESISDPVRSYKGIEVVIPLPIFMLSFRQLGRRF